MAEGSISSRGTVAKVLEIDTVSEEVEPKRTT